MYVCVWGGGGGGGGGGGSPVKRSLCKKNKTFLLFRRNLQGLHTIYGVKEIGVKGNKIMRTQGDSWIDR